MLAATIWVGGQLTLAGLVPTLRRSAGEAVPLAAGTFAKLAWPAFAVLVATGIWNIAANPPSSQTGAWRIVLWVKISLVAVSGLAAWWHQRSKTRLGLAVGGALTSLSAISALFLGVALAG